MSDEDVLLKVVLERPDDDTARLVYADAVQERDEDLAALIRRGVPCHCNAVPIRPKGDPFCQDCKDRLWVPRCQHSGCRSTGRLCEIEDSTSDKPHAPYLEEWFCEEHCAEHGFCPVCGSFWGGIESFEAHGICDICRDQVRADFDDGGEDEWDGDIDGIMEYGEDHS